MNDDSKTIPSGTSSSRRASIGDADKTIPDSTPRSRRFVVGDVLLERYRILSELGQGGMGVVYKCLDETAGVDVALKALPPELSHNTAEMEEVRENFQLVSKLVHQNIAVSKNLEVDHVTGDCYLVMECAEGEDLKHWSRKHRTPEGGVPLQEALPILHQVAAALDYAHAERIMHRDIKPGNIMVSTEGKVKVLDFGLAAQIHTSLSHVSLAYSGTSGTGAYMAPEQWRGRAQGAATDQYALAVTAYQMLSGHLPFDAPDTAVLREAVLNEDADDIDGLPVKTQKAIKKAMSKTPAERYSCCREFVAAMEGKAWKGEATAHDGDSFASSTSKRAGASSLNAAGGKAWLLAVALVIVCLGGGYWLHQWRMEKKRMNAQSLMYRVQNIQGEAQKKGAERYDASGFSEAKLNFEKAEGALRNNDYGNVEVYCERAEVAFSKSIATAMAEIQKAVNKVEALKQTADTANAEHFDGEGYAGACEDLNGALAARERGAIREFEALCAKAEKGFEAAAETSRKVIENLKQKGYEIRTENGKPIEYWPKGSVHPQNALLVAGEPGVWICSKPGYVWDGESGIVWKEGLVHPEDGELVSSSEKDVWNCTIPGYVWTQAQGKKWKKGLSYEKYPHWITVDREGYWRPAPGYKKEDPDKEGLGTLIWNSRWVSDNGMYRAGGREGDFEEKLQCKTCNGKKTVSSETRCAYCHGTGKVEQKVNCGTCSGTGYVTRSQTCGHCNGHGQVTVPCPDCGQITNNGIIVSYHGQICDRCKGTGKDPEQSFAQNLWNLGAALNQISGRPGQGGPPPPPTPCQKCGGNGWYHHSTCNATGKINETCSTCNGSGMVNGQVRCSSCYNGKVEVTESCSHCYDGLVTKTDPCSDCDGNGFVWSPLQKLPDIL